jgi:site-specific recombinase XerD
VDIKQVCEMLGHSTIGVTEIYLEEDRERQSAAITDFENAALA